MNELSTRTTGSAWSSLYRIGGAAILIAIPIYLLDIGISLAVEGADISPAALTATELFVLYQNNLLLGLRALGIINVATLTVSVPMFLALYAAHRREYSAYAALALAVWLVGATVYISNNVSLPMLALSSKYTAATADSQRALLAAAGEAMIARGADFTPGSFVGFFFTEMGAMAFSLIMLRSRVFSKATAYSGIAGFVLLSVATVCSTFFPSLTDAALAVSTIGGLSGLAWYLLVAVRLLRLGADRETTRSKE